MKKWRTFSGEGIELPIKEAVAALSAARLRPAIN